METRIIKKCVLKKKVKRYLNKTLVGIIIFLVGIISVKNNDQLRGMIQRNVYETSIPFMKLRNQYDKYIGSFLSLSNKKETVPVSSNKISYEKYEEMNNGVMLTVEENYPIPAIESGIIIFLGEKEEYGKVIIVEQINGVETLYACIDFKDFKLYDYIEKNEIIGQASKKELFLAFQKNGEYLNYKEQI